MAVTIHTRNLSETDAGIKVGDLVRRVGDPTREAFVVDQIQGRTAVHTTFRGLTSTDGDCIVWISTADGDVVQTWAQDTGVVPADEPWGHHDQLIVDATERCARRWLRPMVTPEVCMVLEDSPKQFVVGAWCEVCKTHHEHSFTPAEVLEFREEGDAFGQPNLLVNLSALVNTCLSNTPICNRK